jgi:hypothetical protein
MLRREQRDFQREEVNCGPRSEVIMAGTPKWDIHEVRRAWAQSAAVVEESGTTSGHLVVRSMMVNRCVNPWEGGSGPTRST